MPSFLRFVPFAALSVVMAACGGASRNGPPLQSPAGQVSPDLSTAQGALVRFFNAPQAKAEWFAPSFLRQVPLEKVQEVMDQVRSQIGTFREVCGAGEDFVASFEHGTVVTHARIDENGRFVGLFLEPPRRTPK